MKHYPAEQIHWALYGEGALVDWASALIKSGRCCVSQEVNVIHLYREDVYFGEWLTGHDSIGQVPGEEEMPSATLKLSAKTSGMLAIEFELELAKGGSDPAGNYCINILQ